MAKNTMTLTDNRNGKSYEYNIIDGTRGPSVVDISTFYKDSGMFTFDPGYTQQQLVNQKLLSLMVKTRNLNIEVMI